MVGVMRRRYAVARTFPCTGMRRHMTTRSRTSLAVGLAGILLIAPLLGGCSLIGNFLPGGSGEIPGGVVPGMGIPSDFPKDDVPLIEGDVLLGLAVPGENGEKAWNVTIK